MQQFSILLLFTLTTCGVVAGSNLRARQASASKPNVILLLTDDQDIVMGSLDYMPILKKLLMEKGTTFNNAFVHSPICCPSRMSILSGRYLQNLNGGNPMNNSISGGCDGREYWRADAEQSTFATHAQAEGYVTSFAGKYLSALNDGVVEGDPLKGTPGCPNCLRVPPGWDKWLIQRQNAIYYDYKTIKSDNGGGHATQKRHHSNYAEDYFPGMRYFCLLTIIHELLLLLLTQYTIHCYLLRPYCK
jgi:arylsulfatase A-like enzyme